MRSTTWGLATTLVLFLFAGCTSMVQKGGMIGAHKQLRKGKYDLALDMLSQAEHARAPSELLAAEIALLRGQCQERAGHVPEAMGAYLYTIERYPETIYANQAQELLNGIRRANPGDSANPAAPHQ